MWSGIGAYLGAVAPVAPLGVLQAGEHVLTARFRAKHRGGLRCAVAATETPRNTAETRQVRPLMVPDWIRGEALPLAPLASLVLENDDATRWLSHLEVSSRSPGVRVELAEAPPFRVAVWNSLGV